MASPATATRPRTPESQARHATASSVEVPCSAQPRPQEMPLAVAMPMRTPVNDPGPRPTSTASTSDMVLPAAASVSSAVVVSSTFARRRQRWSPLASTRTSAPPSRGVHSATAQASMSVEVSRARTMRGLSTVVSAVMRYLLARCLHRTSVAVLARPCSRCAKLPNWLVFASVASARDIILCTI